MSVLEPVLCCKVAVASATYAIDKPYTYLVPDSFSQTLRPGMRVIVPFGKGNRRSEGLVLDVALEQPEVQLKWPSAILDEEPVVDADGIRLALWMRERYFCTVYDAVKAMLPAGLYYDLQDSYHLAPGIDSAAWQEEHPCSETEKRVLSLISDGGGSIQRKALREAFGQTNPSRSLRRLMEDGVLQLETSAQRGVGDKSEEVATLAVSQEIARETVSKSRSKARKAVVELLCSVGSASAKDVTYFTGTSRRTLKDLEKAGLVTLFHREIFRRPETDDAPHQEPPELTTEQQAAYDGLTALLEQEKPACGLLYGVTGSGKTSVYIRLIHRTLQLGRTALVLVPEIGLTPQMMRQFIAQFGDRVAVLHSSLSAGERYDEWKRARRGEASVVIGTRSAVFAPLKNIGLIILDEEQEASYKSENLPRYHAAEVAKFRCTQQNALLVLGSATPSVESMYLAQTGKYHLFRLDRRYNGRELPRVLLSDTREDLRQGNDSSIGGVLRDELSENLRRGEQSILLLNRRGASRMVICAECGEVPQCSRCSVHLTYHKANGRLMCHYCGHSEPLPSRCPVCGGPLVFVGYGTQRLEEDLAEQFSGTPVLRLDADTVSAAHTHRQLLQKFEREKIPILIGTQMVAKGLDFENVTLVGVIDADMTLHMDDFRAGERTFSLLTQVVGRAGRGLREGRAVIQTFQPKNSIITAARQDYDGFYAEEIHLRSMRQLPPFRDLIVLTVTGPEEGAVLRSSMRLRDGLMAWQGSPLMEHTPFSVLGPAPANIVKVNGRYRYRLTVTGRNNRPMRQMISQLLRAASEDKQNRGLAVFADVNPMDG
ncbi:MAG: primosomal protein N' [Clostridiales bacterium]|nr:primosomal protein N' [Clostridiales bacterium]